MHTPALMHRNFSGYQGGNSFSSTSKLKEPSEYLCFYKIAFFGAPVFPMSYFKFQSGKKEICGPRISGRR